MPWNFSRSPAGGDFVGYILAIKSGNQTNWWGDQSREIVLGQFVPIFYDYYIRANYQFTSDITGSHHIDITRNQKGEFNVYFDSKRIITYKDTRTPTSEMCVFGSWTGDSSFDNITVSDSVDITSSAPSIELTLMIPSAVLILVIYRLNKKRKKN